MAAVIPALLTAQSAARRFRITGAAGVGHATGNATYVGRLIPSLRLGVGGPLTPTLGLEFDIARAVNIGGGSTLALPIPEKRTPVDHQFTGASMSLVMTPRSSNGEPRVRLLAGTGLYRVTAEQFATQKTPAVIALSFHAGIESAIKRWSHSTLFLGVRTITMPSVNSEWLWYFPIEIGLRLR